MNPFLINGYADPSCFCGRKQETEAMIQSLRSGVNITLRSPRRIGKTGLIKNVFYQLTHSGEDVACFYVDIYATKCLHDFVDTLGRSVMGKIDTPLQHLQQVALRFFRSCRLYLSQDILTGEPQIGLDFAPEQSKTTLEDIFAYLAASGKQCYIAIDEFQQIAEYPEGGVEALLRTHVQELQNVHFIFSGSKQHLMQELFTSPKRPFYRSTEKHTLDVLPREEYYIFAEEKMKAIGKVLTQETFDYIYDMVDGITWYVQFLLNRLYDAEEKELSIESVQHALRTIVTREEDDYRRMYNQLTLNQAQVLRAVAKERIVSEIGAREFVRNHNLPAASSIKRSTDWLLNNEYLYKTDNGYIVYDRFFAIWLRSAL